MAQRVTFVVGARPNFMKAAPVLRSLRQLDPAIALKLVHTGQHYDAEMSDVFLTELGLPVPDAFLGVGSGTHGEQTSRALHGVERILLDDRADLLVVAGDVNSTLAAALAAAKLGVPVAHIESGLRSFDRTMPEEHNRRLTDHLSDVLLAPSADAVANLGREGIDTGVHLVGNTMIDSVLEHLAAARAAEPWTVLGLDPGSYALVTLHRPALVDSDALLSATASALVSLSDVLPVVFPVHPRTRARLEKHGLDRNLERAGVVLCAPLGYTAFLGLEAEARLVLTDSGGVQEETSALGVPCFTLRDTTERPITVERGTNTVLGSNPLAIAAIPDLLAGPRRGGTIPLWDGAAGSRAARVLLDAIAAQSASRRLAA